LQESRCHPSGIAEPIRHRRKWPIRWNDADGKRRREVYEDFNDARRALRTREVEANQIRAGTRAKRPEDQTLAELCDLWLVTRGAAKRSAKDDRSLCNRLRAFFGDACLLTPSGVEDADGATSSHHASPSVETWRFVTSRRI